MNATTHKLLQDALQLPENERAQLADSILESLDKEVDEDAQTAWEEEIRRRLAEIDSGAVRMIPWAEARRMILDTTKGSRES